MAAWLWWNGLVTAIVLVHVYLRWRASRPPPRPVLRRCAIYANVFIGLACVMLRRPDPEVMYGALLAGSIAMIGCLVGELARARSRGARGQGAAPSV